MGQLFGFGPEIPLVRSYESQPIVNDLKDSWTGFPVSRSLEVKNGDKTSVSKLFSTTDAAIATTKLSSNAVNPSDPAIRKVLSCWARPARTTMASRTITADLWLSAAPAFLPTACSRFQANRDLALNILNWLSSDEDLISIRPKEPEDRRLNVTQRQMTLFAYTDFLAIPLLIIVGGVAIFLKRR